MDHVRTYIYNENQVVFWIPALFLGQQTENQKVKSFQMYVPNGVGAFGSTYKEINDLDEGWNFFLTRTRWRYLDRETQRCGKVK